MIKYLLIIYFLTVKGVPSIAMTYMSHNAYKKTKKGKQEQHRVQDLTGKQPMGGGTGSTFAHTLPAPTSSNSSWMASLSSGSSAANRANRLVAPACK
jgi:hypothetical protein